MLRIVIHNHEQVAKLHSKFASFAATLAPGYLRRRVEEDFATQLRAQLAEHGIVADISVEPDPRPDVKPV